MSLNREKGDVMKVLLVNGSPHKAGSTNRALEEVARTLQESGVEAEIFWLGAQPLGGCAACGACSKLGRCVFDDAVNAFREKAAEADGFVFGGPTHYARAGASLLGFMDRLFYSNGRAGEPDVFAHKPAAAVSVARRAGTTSALADIEKFFTFAQMPIVSSRYWNLVYGNGAEDIEQDAEGLWTMRQLGRNMAWLLRCIEAGRAAGVAMPASEEGVWTNFVR